MTQGCIGFGAALRHNDRVSLSRSPLLSRARTRRLARSATWMTAVLAVSLAACGGDEESNADPEGASPTNTVSAVTLNGEWPLTGRELDGDLPDHPVYVVKIDNTQSSAPQVGLDSADMVVEELVEGGLTRLAVFYHEEAPKMVGPVRSMRASDIGIVKPVSASLVASGASPRTTARISGAKIPTVREDATRFYRDASRSAPHNLFVELSKVAAEPGKDWDAPQNPYLPFGDEDDFEGDISVASITAMFSGGHTTRWEYAGGEWQRADSLAERGKDFEPANILLLRVKTRDAGYLDPAGNPVPETVFSGTGGAALVHGDKAVRCVWSKRFLGSSLELRTENGDPVTVPAGHTWIELVPVDGGRVTLGR